MKCSDLMVKCLEEEGIEYIFGVPGEENANFMLSLQESDKIQFILTRQEQGAAFMADVYGRLTGNPAACLGTLGPGATNLVTGVADANMDHAPLLCLTAQADTERQHKASHQVMDVIAMYRPITKWAQSIYHPDNTPEIIRKAVRLARGEKPGACLVELPEDIAGREATTTPIKPRRYDHPSPDEDVINAAWEIIRSAKKPVILAGSGTMRRDAAHHLRNFVAKTGIGVISTFMAKGVVDMDDETCTYTIGLQAHDYPAVAIDESDLVITVGYDMVEYHPDLWNKGNTHRIVHIDFLPAEIDDAYRTEIEVLGDLADALEMLTRRLDAQSEPPQYDHSHTRRARELMRKDIEEYKDDDIKGPIKPQKALWDARQVLGPDDVLLSDVGAHKMWIARYYHCHEPNTCLISNGFCSMGFALPGAIAAQLVKPKQRILAVCGDGGFLMNAQEMETAKRLNSNIVVMVWEDHGYGLISWKQENEFDRHTDLSFGNPDWLKLADAFGWNGYWCEDSSKLAQTLEAAFDADGPSLVAIPIDYRENELLTERLGKIQVTI
ncbi:MAG TPA: acetolactate synthase large subunit [Gammaproteobacteria bacterium]|nr:acetolactate synthase large subunit [Gammaproteobacteria bacterium]